MDITRGACDQFKTTSYQRRRRWKTIKVKRLQVQIEVQLSDGCSYLHILNSSRAKIGSFPIVIGEIIEQVRRLFFQKCKSPLIYINNSCHKWSIVLRLKFSYLDFVKRDYQELYLSRLIYRFIQRFSNLRDECKIPLDKEKERDLPMQ